MKTRDLKVGNVRLSVSDGKIPTVGISLKAPTERINKRTPRGLLFSL